MRIRYDRPSDRMQILFDSKGEEQIKQVDEDVSVAYSKEGKIVRISINNALSRIFEGLGVQPPIERQRALAESEGSIKVEVDVDRCLGFGSCVTVSPDVFRLDERPGKGVFVSRAKLDVLDESGGQNVENVMIAARTCPTQAISIWDTKTGRRIYPT